MIILGIETSCDETACSILLKEGNRIIILSNVVASSALLQSKYGGIIPEQAAREQLKSIIPVIEEALAQAFPSVIPSEQCESRDLFNQNFVERDSSTPLRFGRNDSIKKIDAIAVTYGPGLIGSLLVGVETAKTLALIWNKPLIPVNHLIGHFYANWIVRGDSERGYQKSTRSEARTSIGAASWQDPKHQIPTFPCLGLLVSGGHTDLVLFNQHGKYEYLGGTRDDAAGECFDKCARVLGYPYPGGPKISKLAELGSSKKYKLPRPMIDSKNSDFSFSGLKTAFVNLINSNYNIEPGHFDSQKKVWVQTPLEEQLTTTQLQEIYDLCASLQEAIIDVLVEKIFTAAKKYNIEQIIVAGGVAANQHLTNTLKQLANEKLANSKVFIPQPTLCTDNGAMIASAAFFIEPIAKPLLLQADPNLSL